MNLTRRGLLAAGTASLLTVSSARAGESLPTQKKPGVRMAHITDVHIMPDREAPAGAAAMLAHMLGDENWRPELILNTGDSVMGVDGGTTGKSAEAQIGVWRDVFGSCPVPIRSSLGNHDVWNGGGPTDAVPLSKKGFGLMTEVLGMPAPYYSFDHGGWHFISLNSLCNWPSYATLSDEHFTWLVQDLEQTSLPTVVLSHIPILSVTSQVYGDDTRKGNDNVVPGTWHHADCWAITEVFRRHPQVKLCLSGHMHTADHCVYRDVAYICGGAASGAWWNGSQYGFPPCYGRLELFEDGNFSYELVDYGWKASEWRGKQLPIS